MNEIVLLFPHQLFEKHETLDLGFPVFLVEEFLFFKQYKFHKQKLTFHRASMKAHQAFLEISGLKVNYIDAQNERADVRVLLEQLASSGLEKLHIINPTDYWLFKRVKQKCDNLAIELVEYESPLFINNQKDLAGFFRADKKSFFQTSFYKQQRKQRDILMDGPNLPAGGKWTFDMDNRKPYPKNQTPPEITLPTRDKYWDEAKTYVEENFSKNYGQLSDEPLYPYTKHQSNVWLQQFIETRFHQFGDYEDAIVKDASILNHSVLTPMMNVGLLQPLEVVSAAIEYAGKHNVPINSLEGFVRQIMGWREFIRGMYECKGVQSRTTNFWGFKRKIPRSFYDGTTGIIPVDETIRKVNETGYCHHIERLMILGNFMLLCEFDPDEVYVWFMELFIDAYDWVMVPNVYGMSQFADGGLFATKPYISGSNYVMKMSDYPKGDWNEVWDGLFWRFIKVNRDFFSKNPRLNMMVRIFDKMNPVRKERLLQKAEEFLKTM
jgi:deoxyribodipyrimidine photolyase-related protein